MSPLLSTTLTLRACTLALVLAAAWIAAATLNMDQYMVFSRIYSTVNVFVADFMYYLHERMKYFISHKLSYTATGILVRFTAVSHLQTIIICV